MIKSTQIKIILIIVLLATLMIASYGVYSIINVEELKAVEARYDPNRHNGK